MSLFVILSDQPWRILCLIVILQAVHWLVLGHLLWLKFTAVVVLLGGGRTQLNFASFHVSLGRCCIFEGGLKVNTLVYIFFKLLESDKDYWQVVNRVRASSCLNNFVADKPWDRVESRWLHPWDAHVSRALESGNIPNNLIYLVVL